MAERPGLSLGSVEATAEPQPQARDPRQLTAPPWEGSQDSVGSRPQVESPTEFAFILAPSLINCGVLEMLLDLFEAVSSSL